MQTTPETHNHRRQSLLLSPSLFLSFAPLVFLATRREHCFTSQGWKLKGVGVSISRRLLIHVYRPPRYSLPECKMATSVNTYVSFFFLLVFCNCFKPPFSVSSTRNADYVSISYSVLKVTDVVTEKYFINLNLLFSVSRMLYNFFLLCVS